MDKKILTATATIFTALLVSACGGSDTEGTVVTLANGEPAGVIMTVPQTEETVTDPLASVEKTSETVETATSAEDGLVVNQTMSAANDYSFTYLGTVITPGEACDPIIEALGTTYDYYEQALDSGTDNQNTTAKIYSYSDLVITALPGVSGYYIDSVYFKTGNCSTSEGIAFGAPSDTVIATYGENYTSEGDAIVYKSGSIKLSFFFNNGKVSDISYAYEPEL